jgi:membrane-associated PAP2 superfamily phosphatase
MNRTGLLIALGIAAIVGVVFAVHPELDIAISGLFYDAANRRWRVLEYQTLSPRNVASWMIALIVAPAVIAVVFKFILPRRPMLIPARAALLMISTLILAPGIVVNLIIKEYGGRPRPWMIKEFGGQERFLPWWDIRGPCTNNCSFVAGEPSGAFWTMAPAAVAPPAWQAAGYGAAIVFGAAVGALRISGGGHFFTDVVFAGVITFLIIWLVHGVLYRWRATRSTDERLEHLLERIATPGYDAVMRIAARIRGVAPRN